MRIEDEIRQENFKNNAEKALINLVFTGNWIGMKQKRYFRKYGISPQQFNVLRILRGQKGEPVTIQLIQERMLDRMSNASRLVDKLYLKQLVNRETNSNDRRQVDITITEKGLSLLDKIDKDFPNLQREIIRLSEEEAANLSELLDRLRS
jgi:DNA-binding MarR family transcriptional regulator